MITIHVAEHQEREYWDSKKEEFVTVPGNKAVDLNLEHSLISISKWEGKWHVPFISKDPHTEEQTLHYIKCMTINQNVPDSVYENLSAENIREISDYIHDPMSATKTYSEGKEKSREVVTSELIYYWMTALQIPFDPCEKWHLNRLLQLIGIANDKQQPPKKMSKEEIMRRNRELNAARRKKLNSKG